MNFRPVQSAFSLVELSVVLVILGLLTGGILAGQSLIRAAELRSVTTEISRYQTAVSVFQDKYFAFPGDMTNAFSFWGATIGCTNTVMQADSAGCNGNGDGQIFHNTSEMLRLWQMLAAAGLIEGSFTGNYNGVTTWQPGTHVPASKIGGAGWGMSWVNPNLYEFWLNTTYGNWMQLGKPFAGNLPISAALKPEEAWNLDTKLDDGLPGTGGVIGGTALGQLNCTSGTTYLLSNSSLVCGIAYKMK